MSWFRSQSFSKGNFIEIPVYQVSGTCPGGKTNKTCLHDVRSSKINKIFSKKIILNNPNYFSIVLI